MIVRDGSTKKWIFLLLLLVVLFFVCAPVAEAAVKDTIKTTWGQMRNFVFSLAFWINAIILFGASFMLYSVTLGKSSGSDKTTKVVIIIVLIILSMVLATKIIGDDGKPVNIWKMENFRRGVQFLIGPQTPLSACTGPEHSFPKAIFSLDPNPDCCGTGSYEVQVGTMAPRCQQAILRMNENGSGLFAFIVASILFFLLLSGFKKNLGLDSMGDKGGRVFVILLAILLGALMANSRVTKNNVVMIGGWIAFFMIGSRLSKSLSSDDKKQMKGLGFGLAYAFIQLIANMLGTTLWGGGHVDPGSINTGSIIWNLMAGLAFGMLWAIVSSGKKSMLGDMFRDMKKRKKAEIDEHMRKGEHWNAFKRWLPLIGKKWSKKKSLAAAAKKTREDIERDIKEMNKAIEWVRRGALTGRDETLWLQRERDLEQRLRELNDQLTMT